MANTLAASAASQNWIYSREGTRICQRLSRIFPLSPDASIRRAAVRALLSHEEGTGEDMLVLDAIHQLSGFDSQYWNRP